MTYERYLEICYHLDDKPITEEMFKEMQELNYD